MSVLTKLLPIGAIGLVGVMNSDALKENLDIIQQAKVAATSGIEMRGIADAVAQDYAEDKRLPILNFSHFLAENLMEKGGQETRDPSKDMWETPYRIYLNVPKNGFEIRSAGQDKTWYSEDDLSYLYVLTGLGGKEAISPGQIREMERLEAYYAQLDARQTSDESSSNELANNAAQQSDATNRRPQRNNNEVERKRLESQMRRAEDGSASAMMALAERMMTGDELVEKDLEQAKKYLEEAVEKLDSETYRRKAERLLGVVNAELGDSK